MNARVDGIDIWCSECGAQFRNDCSCPETLELAPPVNAEGGVDVWVGVDGHTYEGDKKRPSSAFHSDTCRCHTTTDW